MKSFLTLICFVLLIQSYGQNTSQTNEKLRFGVSAGVNFTTSPALSYFENAPGFKTYHKSKFGAGFDIKATMEYFFRESAVSMQPEVGFALYNQKQVYKSSLNEFADGAASQRDKIEMSSITVADIFRYNTKIITIATGPRVDFLLNAKIHNRFRINSTPGSAGSEENIDFKKEKMMNTAMFSWVVGVERTIVEHWSVYLNYQ
ncbi:MAG: outer membrane beta-barrel protein [Sphingobacteriales bacterium]|nr:outer membrane beta-barrel protein [Sphingobacteriales bacterium]